MMEKENIIQAFSRTNRIFGHDKSFGLIYYYRKPNTMEKNIDEAIAIYSGDKASLVYVTKLEPNLVKFNAIYEVIKSILNRMEYMISLAFRHQYLSKLNLQRSLMY